MLSSPFCFRIVGCNNEINWAKLSLDSNINVHVLSLFIILTAWIFTNYFSGYHFYLYLYLLRQRNTWIRVNFKGKKRWKEEGLERVGRIAGWDGEIAPKFSLREGAMMEVGRKTGAKFKLFRFFRWLILVHNSHALDGTGRFTGPRFVYSVHRTSKSHMKGQDRWFFHGSISVRVVH